MRILYATQTGNARDLAFRLGHSILQRDLSLSGPIESLSTFPISQWMSESFLIIICSTTGDGQFPDSCQSVWSFLLKRSLPDNVLSHLKVAVFGCGDKSYVGFNQAARRLWMRLMQLGAKAACPLGEGDEQHPLGLEGAFRPWKISLFQSLNLSQTEEKMLTISLLSKYRFNATNVVSNEKSQLPITAMELNSKIFKVKVQSNNRMTHNEAPTHVRELILSSLSNENEIRPFPGCSLVLFPQMTKEAVDLVLDAFQWNLIADNPISIQAQRCDAVLPSYWESESFTLRFILTYHLDLLSPPKLLFFQIFSSLAVAFAQHPNEQVRLQYEKVVQFLEDPLEYISYISRPRRTLIEVLQDLLPLCQASQIEPERVYELFSPIQPREYSLASTINERHWRICYQVIEYKNPWIRAMRKGVASHWMYGLQENTCIYVAVKEHLAWKPFLQTDQTVIAIGAGTGIAPLRSLILSRLALQQEENKNVLIHGYRNPYWDALYQSDFISLPELLYFPSESQPLDSQMKYHVQDTILAQSALLVSLWKKGSIRWIVCGHTRLKRAVEVALIAAWNKETETFKKSESVALNRTELQVNGTEAFNELIRQHRILFETWS